MTFEEWETRLKALGATDVHIKQHPRRGLQAVMGAATFFAAEKQHPELDDMGRVVEGKIISHLNYMRNQAAKAAEAARLAPPPPPPPPKPERKARTVRIDLPSEGPHYIERIAEGRMWTLVMREPPLWRCSVCEAEWRWPTQPQECGACAAADDRAVAGEIHEAEDIKAVAPGVIEADEEKALQANPYKAIRTVAGLGSFKSTRARHWNSRTEEERSR